MGRFEMTTLFLGSILGFVASGCAINPVTGHRQLALMSESQEIQQGRESDPQIRSEFGIVKNTRLQEYVAGIGHKLAKVSHRPNIEWHFVVVDTPVLNAFALPGGYIYFARQILAYMNNEAELAAVMGHEIGHVTARHAVAQMSKAQLANLGLGLGSILSPTVRQLGDLAQTGLGLLFLKYGRDDEREADQLGVEYSTKAGYDPREASGFFEVLNQASEPGEQRIPSWLSTHPDPPERVQATKSAAEEWIRKVGPRKLAVGHEEYLAGIDGLVFGENPREGFSDKGIFYHPEMRFQITFPEHWRIQNTKQSVIALEPNRGAQIELSIVAATPGMSPESYAAQLARKGLTPRDGRKVEIKGNPAYTAIYRLQSQSGQPLDAFAAFISYRNSMFQILCASGAAFQQHFRQFQDTIWSFRALTDRRILNVQPDRIRVIKTAGGKTLRQLLLAQGVSPRIKPETVASLNRLPMDGPLQAGVMVKVIESGRP